MLSELGNFFLAMAFGFGSVQVLSSFWGIHHDKRYLRLGKVSTYIQGALILAAFITLMIAFFYCDFTIITVALNDHHDLPWFYRLASTWGNHEGSLLLFVLILSGLAVALAIFIKDPLFRARSLTIQGCLTVLFLTLLLCTSNPFDTLPYPMKEGESLNPLLQDRGLLFHPTLLYLGYVGFSAPFSLAVSALWGREDGATWATVVRPWVLFAWGTLTGGITLGSWWAYYELGWGGWWFWDPVENASLMPWLAGTALLHTIRTGKLYRWSLFLSLLTFNLSLLGTFLIRSGLITSVHSFVQSPERGVFILTLISFIMGFGLLMWIFRAPRLQSSPLNLLSREGALLINSLLLCVGLGTIILGTLYPLASEWIWGKTLGVGTPYFERTFVPLMIPLLIFIPIGSLLRNEKEPLGVLLMTPLTATLAAIALILYIDFPASLTALVGCVVSVWVFVGTLLAFLKKKLSLGPALAHIGVAVSLLGVSSAGGFRVDVSQILSPQSKMKVGGFELTLLDVIHGEESTHLFERALISYPGGTLKPEKRLYKPKNSLLTETAISTNGFRDLYVILGPYQGDNQWLIKGSILPLAPWIWFGGALMVCGAIVSFFRRLPILVLVMVMTSSNAIADKSNEERARALQQEIRCPVCIGQSINDSDTDESIALRIYILEELNKGKSEEEIRQKLRENFGDEILFRPPFEERTFFLWLAPFFIFFLVLAWAFWKLRLLLKR